MDKLIQELKIEIKRNTYPFDQVSAEYLLNFEDYFNCPPTDREILHRLHLKRSFPKVNFIDKVNYSVIYMDSNGAIAALDRSVRKSSLKPKELYNSFKDFDGTLVVGFITESSVYYDILPKEYKNIIIT